MEEYDSEIEDDIDDIISQLKNSNNSMKTIEKEYPELTTEEVDDFIINKATQVITDASEAISDLKDTLTRGATSNDVIAFSELIKAFSSAVDILGKRKIADNKNKTQKEIKQMEIDSRSDNDDNAIRNNLTLTREEVFNLMMKKNKDNIIDI